MKTLLLLSILAAIGSPKASEIDRIVGENLKAKGLEASAQSDPERLVRRLFLVATDRIPTETQVRGFLRNPDRTALVDSLVSSDGFVGKQVLKWGDLLRIKSEFPSCMWPNAVQAFNKWLTDEFRSGKPYNEFVRDLLSGTGSNFRVPQINFYRAGSDRSCAKFASDCALLFHGRRKAPAEWEPFFCQIRFKSTKEWKEEILWLDVDEPGRDVTLDGRKLTLKEGSDFRKPFIDWLCADSSHDLARAYAGRMWFWFTGVALVSPVDGLDIAEGNLCPELLDYLTESFVASGYNVRTLARAILLSDCFCRSSLSEKGNGADRTGFSHFALRRLEAEQICDAICLITGVWDKYSSRAPEPFTNFPEGTLAIDVCDGTITTPQLDIFGRPSRDVALESGRDISINPKQTLYLLNSSDIQEKLKKSPYISSMVTRTDVEGIIDGIYLRVLARHALPEEISTAKEWAQGHIIGGNPNRRLAEVLVWALLNTDEFLFLN